MVSFRSSSMYTGFTNNKIQTHQFLVFLNTNKCTANTGSNQTC